MFVKTPIKTQFLLKNLFLIIPLVLWSLTYPSTAYSYIGPGAGFAFLGSAFAFLVTFFVAFLLILFWPVRLLWKSLTGKKISKNARARRVIIVGLDGLDPLLTEKYMGQGKLPNLSQLAKDGSYKVLTTTCPSISPVAWSTFQTGVNPGAHSIFDFLTRDKRSYLPKLSSCAIAPPRETLQFWKWKMALGKPVIRLLRKSKPFWKVLGENGVFSNILRVPITFPPEKFHGNILAAMCTPDLKGSQGTFSLYSSRLTNEMTNMGGNQIAVHVRGNTIESYLEGPDDPSVKEKTALKVPFCVNLNDKDECILKIVNETVPLRTNEFSDWIRIKFKTKLGHRIKGICRFCVRQIRPHFDLYVSPINIDPENPALPVSSPLYYSRYLAKLNGPFGTLGLMEDTWALNEQALDDQTFLRQVYLTHNERERMFFDALEKTREGVCVCVFDASDRIQHMFWRYLEDDHPANKQNDEASKNAIPEMYRKMDDLVGRAIQKLDDSDILFVLSDHGFKSFKRCVNVNTWLVKNGYMTLRHNKITGNDYFADVEWSGTKAFAIGMGGIFLNIKGRESQGIVNPGDALHLKQEVSAKLLALRDPLNGTKPIRKMYDSGDTYVGPYKHEAPDLFVGWENGYRASWESVTGKLKPEIFEDNTKAWSGDHCVDSGIVPGVLFSNRKISNGAPKMVDIAPTILDLFDIKVPQFMEGKPLTII
jgi:predicted AlkP superfamily phosphohydrolase/phosphomutase